MGRTEWWKKLGLGPGAPSAEAPRIPQERGSHHAEEATELRAVELSAGLAAHEYAHAIDTGEGLLRMRTFVTEGLAALGAQEVSATVPLDWGDDPIRAVLELFQQLERLAAERKPAVLGGYTGFQSSVFGGGRSLGVTYARGTPIRGIPVGSFTLAAVLLHEEELRLAQHGLATRVLGRLALRARCFPYPAWWEVRDLPVLGAREQEQSLLERINPHVHTRDARVSRVEEIALVVSLPTSAAETFRALWAEHPDLEMFALLADLSPDADGQMVWVPGATEPQATAAGEGQPRRVGYSFAIFVGTGDQNFYRGIEDGASVVLSTRNLERLRDALIAGTEFTLPLDDRMTLQVTVRPKSVVDPFTGQDIRAGLEQYTPTQVVVDKGRVSDFVVVLLISEHLLAERMDVHVLSEFIRAVRATMERLAGDQPVAAVTPVVVQFTLSPGAPLQVKVGYQAAELPQILDALYSSLSAMPPIEIRGEVTFRVDALLHPHPLGN